MSSAPVGYEIEFFLDRAPRSSKNRRQLFKVGGQFTSKLSKEAQADVKVIKDAAAKSLDGKTTPFDEWDALDLTYDVDVHDGTMVVRVRKVGEIPRTGKKGTRQDVHASFETIADALEGILYPNDRSIDSGSFQRVR